MICNKKGLPIRFEITSGQTSDYNQAIPLLGECNAKYVLADRGYDSDQIIDYVRSKGAIPVIPPRRNRIVQRKYDKTIYRERNLVERLFGKLKQFRKIATRFEKLACSFKSLIYLARVYLWIS